jgi:flagellar basal-body rod modification protein FlgD
MEIAAAAGASAAGTARSKLSANFDTFLLLLTEQLRHQDPTDPMDTAEFTQQLVQYSQVEQQISTNASLETLLSLQRADSAAGAVGYLGRTVVTKGDLATLSGGAANWTYQLPANTAATQLIVTDAKGRIVFNQTGQRAAGTHAFAWDGKSASGQSLPDGVYRLEVKAADAAGAGVTATVSSSGVVTETDLSGAEAALKIGARRVSMSDILSIKAQ